MTRTLFKRAKCLALAPVASLTFLGAGLIGCEGSDEECEPKMWYGPAPCTSNEQCAEERGAGWYCDFDHAYDSGCSTTSWPLCTQGDATDETDAAGDSDSAME